VIDTGEACDDAENNADDQVDACRSNCALPSCGDGVTDSGEECDDDNENNDDLCRNDCSLRLGAAQAQAGLHCEAILDAEDSLGDGNYWIDPNGGGTNDAFQVYCDMDGGGYTRLQLYGGRTSRSYSDCSPHDGYGTNDFMGSGHPASCSGNQVEVTWHDANDQAISGSQITAMSDYDMVSKPTPNWVRDADGSTDDVRFCMGESQVHQWAWSPKSQANDNSCFQTNNAVEAPIFNKWSASTGAQQSGQDWMMERYWYFR
jgi:hypothetical protein